MTEAISGWTFLGLLWWSLLPEWGRPSLDLLAQTQFGSLHCGASSCTPSWSLSAYHRIFEAFLHNGNDTNALLYVHDKVLWSTTCPDGYLQLNLPREHKLHCGDARLGSLLDLVPFWDGLLWPLSRSHSWGLRPLGTSFERVIFSSVSPNLVLMKRALKKFWGSLGKELVLQVLDLEDWWTWQSLWWMTMMQSTEHKMPLVLRQLSEESHTMQIGQSG